MKDFGFIGGGSNGGTWGTIKGTLSNQADLTTELDLKQPITDNNLHTSSKTITGAINNLIAETTSFNNTLTFDKIKYVTKTLTQDETLTVDQTGAIIGMGYIMNITGAGFNLIFDDTFKKINQYVAFNKDSINKVYVIYDGSDFVVNILQLVAYNPVSDLSLDQITRFYSVHKSIITKDVNNKVSEITDLSVNNISATQPTLVNQPTYSTSPSPHLAFTGGASGTFMYYNTTGLTVSKSACTIVFVMNTLGTINGIILDSDVPSWGTVGYIWFRQTVGVLVNQQAAVDATEDWSTKKIVLFNFKANSSCDVYVNSPSSPKATVATVNNSGIPNTLGSLNTYGFSGNLWAFLQRNKESTTNEITTIFNYFNGIYNVY